MKKNALFLPVLLLISGLHATTVPSTGPYDSDQSFYFRPQPLPLTGVDMLRKEAPYILVRDVTNATNGKQENRLHMITLPGRSGTSHYKNTSAFTFDKTAKKWLPVNERQYAITYAGQSGERIASYLMQRNLADTAHEQLYYRVFADQFPVDSVQVYFIQNGDTTLKMREYYTYSLHPYPDLLVQVDAEGRTTEHRFSYDGQGALISECILENRSGRPADTLTQLKYGRDTIGRLISYDEITYRHKGMEGKAFTAESRGYGYDAAGRVASCKTYKPDSSMHLVPEQTELYTYTQEGKPETIVSMTLHDGHIFSIRKKIEIFYERGKPAYAWEYPWKDNDYSHFASGYYLFSVTDPLLSVSQNSLYAEPLPGPNPCERFLYLPESWQGKIQLFDLQGRLMMETVKDESGKIDLELLPAGTYYVSGNGRHMTLMHT